MSEGTGKKVESRRKDRTAFKAGGDWYPCTKEVGEYVNNNDVITVKEIGPETNEYDKQIVKKVEVLERGYQPNSGGSGGAKNSGGGNDADRQGSIIRQSCMGYAATVVASTLTGKSNPKEAAELVVEIADNFLVPYATSGQKPSGGAQKAPEKEEPASSEPEQEESSGNGEDPPF